MAPDRPSDAVRDATRNQNAASDPTVSAFVAASAGSGKTKLLVDRLLRLMLPGPGRPATGADRILCLTFTKAAAAEMAIRLRHTLGTWVALDDDALDQRLLALALAPDAPTRAAARALFARVLDVPGGLRIGTVHAFCERLLRRFPLEARLSPQFRLLDEPVGIAALDAAREAAFGIAGGEDAVAIVAALVTAVAHGGLTRTLRTGTDRLGHARELDPGALARALRGLLGVAHDDAAALLAAAVQGADEPALRAALARMTADGTTANGRDAALRTAWLERAHDGRAETWTEWHDYALTDGGKPRQVVRLGRFATANPDVLAVLLAEAERVAAVEDDRRALLAAEASAALLRLAFPALDAFRVGKERTAALDFDDLIDRTNRLLADPGVAWVLFKLDGGLDHLLLDEVQDTSATQWAIAGRLTEEFFTGAGARGDAGEGRGARRTVFAVGDPKQSIFSFQGANPDAFRHWRAVFRARVADSGGMLAEPALNVSFRSAQTVLDFVDAVFRLPLAADGVAEPGAGGVAEPGTAVPRHRAADPDLPGRVELWPLARGTDAPADNAAAADDPWTAPDPASAGATAPERLADAIARRVRSELDRGTLTPGDVLVLVRRRTPFADALVRALERARVPVAGLDRITLTDQPAVADLLALCDAILLPEDDLALATVLTSPLGFCDDAGMTALATGRGARSLWDTLRARAAERPDWSNALDLLVALRARVGAITPHALLADVLGPRGGRARFYARLGPECGDAIDELLAAALAHERDEPPALVTFVHALRRAGAAIKRESGEGGGLVRLMTVHGAKGLEGRLVILADTVSTPDRNIDPLFWAADAEGRALPLWVPNKEHRSRRTDALRAEAVGRAFAEYNRLLYVALTRAREALIVCGWAGAKDDRTGRNWYALCASAIGDMPNRRPLDANPFDDPAAPAGGPEGNTPDGNTDDAPVETGFAVGPPIAPARPRAPTTTDAPAPLPPSPPTWLGRPPLWRAVPPAADSAPDGRTLTPSRPENGLFPPPAAASPVRRAGSAAVRRRGQALHALLQHLPSLPPASRSVTGRALARARLGPAATSAELDALLAEAFAVLDHPALAAAFGPDGRAEQRVAGRVGPLTVDGVVDRLLIAPGRTIVLDFKSGRDAPADPERTPVAYLRQMSAYRAVLEQLRPGIPVDCALLWTATATVSHLPAALLDRHDPAGVVRNDPRRPM